MQKYCRAKEAIYDSILRRFSTSTMFTRTRRSVTLYVHILDTFTKNTDIPHIYALVRDYQAWTQKIATLNAIGTAMASLFWFYQYCIQVKITIIISVEYCENKFVMFYGEFMHCELANTYNFSEGHNSFLSRVKNIERSG